MSSPVPAFELPTVGSVYVWELYAEHARALIEVVETKWNGEEWWIGSKFLLPTYYPPAATEVVWNDLARFNEATIPVVKSPVPKETVGGNG